VKTFKEECSVAGLFTYIIMKKPLEVSNNKEKSNNNSNKK
jgi:hypothetical protein